jgi:hypothetical protein
MGKNLSQVFISVKSYIEFIQSNLLTLVHENYIISYFYLYLGEKIMVLAQKILQSSRLLIRFALMQNELLKSSYPKGRF